ncbi:MAG: OmpA family protein [Cyanobacteria bacterium HKST-UBA02]|nr:OmpA family protein [Cyanobacteria bacterium HKST-UBA02]
MEQSHASALGSHDESYFASFTDMLVGILFIFIILLVMVASNYQNQQNESRKATEAVTKIIESRNVVLNEIGKSLEKAGVKVEIDLEQGILRLPESILFDVGSDQVNPNGKAALAKLASVLEKYLPCLAVADEKYRTACDCLELKSKGGLEAVFIEGHTDASGSEHGYDNWGLSARRAITVFRELTASKPILDRGIVNSHSVPVLGVSGYEARRPVSTTDPQQNRRIDLRFIMRSPTPEDVDHINDALGR